MVPGDMDLMSSTFLAALVKIRAKGCALATGNPCLDRATCKDWANREKAPASSGMVLLGSTGLGAASIQGSEKRTEILKGDSRFSPAQIHSEALVDESGSRMIRL